MTQEQKENIKAAAWLNLFIGLYNLYLYNIGGDFFWNFIIGSLNIGVWVFYRNVE
tara:strand:+ start:176 stop:340 length:165 start_codon:yes stop_codon:yes gene_type:complete